ncbi:hypothetical protein CEXT_108901 [Caerostris extrusa]|uniref:Uncharacterized protein n=1 Tax=Caerostris extrusa TaxID=172846 RepID=A0AAV4UYM0_CAEEX|nr:hypothetical protein CEXT_108901 [Caerostris extrusa]
MLDANVLMFWLNQLLPEEGKAETSLIDVRGIFGIKTNNFKGGNMEIGRSMEMEEVHGTGDTDTNLLVAATETVENAATETTQTELM